MYQVYREAVDEELAKAREAADEELAKALAEREAADEDDPKAKAETEAKEIVTSEISQARADAGRLIDQTNKELDAQKTLALQKLETQIDELSQLIKEKLIGKEVVV